jgi:APA family basic amino acid/polyamine antiporter
MTQLYIKKSLSYSAIPMETLERSLSLWEVTLMSIGIILGAGIYVVIGEAAGLSGNAVWLSFIIAAIVATFTGLSYAELSSRFPKAGAEYVYVENSFGRHAAWVVGWLIIAGSVIGSATVSLGFSRYFSALFNTPVLLTGIVMLLIVGSILLAGVKETATLTILFMAIEALGLAIIIFVGIPFFGSINYLEFAQGTKGVIEAGVLIFFGYLGFEGITRLAEETKNPEKTIPRAILLSLGITTVIYILVGLAAVSVVPWQDLAQAQAPLALVAERVFGENSFLILSVIALFSTFNTALVMLLSGSRLVFGMADQQALPRMFLQVLKRFRTPWTAILGVMVVSILFLFLGDLKTVANLTNFTIFAVFIVINGSVVFYRLKKPFDSGFRIPGAIKNVPIIPLLGIMTSLFMIINLSIDVLAIGSVLLILGILFSYLLEKHRRAGSFS